MVEGIFKYTDNPGAKAAVITSLANKGIIIGKTKYDSDSVKINLCFFPSDKPKVFKIPNILL